VDPIAAWTAVRAMEHRERMEMIRRGMMPAPYAPMNASVALVLLLGVILLAAAYLIGLGAIAYPVTGDVGLSLVGGALLALAAIAVTMCARRRTAAAKKIKDAGASLTTSKSINKDVMCR